MLTAKRKTFRIKLFVIGFACIVAIFGFLKFSPEYEKVTASSSGPPASHSNAPGEANCTACHTDFPVNSGTGSVRITGIPANYLPNQQIPITVTVNEENAVIYGFQLTAIDSAGRKIGAYTLPTQTPQQMQIVPGLVQGNEREYIEQTSAGVAPTQFGTKSWTFTWTAPSTRVGKISFYAAGNGANSNMDTSGDYIYTTNRASLSGSAIANFDGDVKSDVSVFRPTNGVWYSINSSNGNSPAFQFGASGDKIVSGDYDGDGITDVAVFRPLNGVWYINKSSGGVVSAQFGANGDIPVVGDYDGDLKSDLAVWRPSNRVWYIWRSSNGTFDIRQFGLSDDKIAQADYDGDGKTDIAVWRPSNGVWYIWRSSDNNFSFISFGLSGDKPVQGDYDGDGKADLAVFRTSNGTWYLLRSRDGFAAAQFGTSTDKPTPADFDGDGKTDIAVFRTNTWYIFRSSDGTVNTIQFGASGDIPVPSGNLAE